MKTRTAVAILWLAVGLTSMCSAEIVVDRGGKEWKCRIPDGKIYTVDGFGNHIYNVPAAQATATESDYEKHDPICISPGREHVSWEWPNAQNIKITFTSLTNDQAGECQKRQPFRSAVTPGNNSVQSDVADANSWGCAYKLTFNSSAGTFDPHIIIRGGGSGGLSLQIKQLKEETKELEEKIEQLNTTLKQVNKDLKRLEEEEKKEEKHHK